MDEVAIGQVIRDKRGVLGISQAALAEKIGVSTPYISQIEKGKKKAGSQTLLKIISALNIPIEELAPPGSFEMLRKEDQIFLNITLEITNKLGEYLTHDQFNEIILLFERMQEEALAAFQVALSDIPMPAGPDGWLRLSKSDQNLVQRLINRLLKSETTED